MLYHGTKFVYLCGVAYLFVKEQTPVEEEETGEDGADEEEEEEEEEMVVCIYTHTQT